MCTSTMGSKYNFDPSIQRRLEKVIEEEMRVQKMLLEVPATRKSLNQHPMTFPAITAAAAMPWIDSQIWLLRRERSRN